MIVAPCPNHLEVLLLRKTQVQSSLIACRNAVAGIEQAWIGKGDEERETAAKTTGGL
nr:hypothetical protein [uncultured Celeribacter sp.]